MAGYVSRVQDDIRRWQDAGLIDAPTAEKLARDVELHRARRISFGSILAMLAALLFAAALLIWVGADWEAIPRLLRVCGLVALILAFAGGGVLLKRRGRSGFAEAAWLAGAAAYGAAIILVGRMYDLSSQESSALLPWCLGTGLAAAAFSSGPLTIAAAGLAAAWLGASTALLDDSGFPFAFPLLLTGLWLVSLRSRSWRARELLLLSLIFYCALLAQPFDALAVGAAMSAGFALLFAAAARWPDRAEALLRVDGHAPVLLLLGIFTGLALVQGSLLDGAGFALAAAASLAAIAAAILIGGRRSSGVRRLAYVAFAAELCIVFGVTVGTALDTASFFTAAALLLAVLAVAVFRLERRWQAPGAAARP